MSEETKKKMADARKKRLKEYGYINSPETRQKMREAHLRSSYKPSSETKLKMSESHKGEKHPRWKGGNPNCKDCGKKLSTRKKSKLGVCKKCSGKYQLGEKNWLWKGGYENRLMNNRKRRIKKIGNGGFHTLNEWQTLKAQYNWTCSYCKRSEPEIKLTEDHVIPISKGGSDNIENIQPLCKSCNSSKGNKFVSNLSNNRR